jgi:hypothetical protein
VQFIDDDWECLGDLVTTGPERSCPQGRTQLSAYPDLAASADNHSRLKHQLRPMRGLCTDRTAQVVIAGHAFMQNLRRGHYELGIDAPSAKRVAVAFSELARAI